HMYVYLHSLLLRSLTNPLLPYTTLFRSVADPARPLVLNGQTITRNSPLLVDTATGAYRPGVRDCAGPSELNCIRSFNMFANDPLDRKSTRLNSSHVSISYDVFCLKKKKH